MSPRTHRYTVRGLELAWHEWGPPNAPVALCIHGFMDHGRSFQFVAEHLANELRIVAPDVRGHGESAWIGDGGYYHFYDYFHDLWRLITLLDLPSLMIVGHSMGGSIATGLSALLGAKVHGLVLLEGMGPSFSTLEESRNRLARWVVTLEQAGVSGDVAERRKARRAMADIGDAAARLMRTNPRLPADRARRLAEGFTEPNEAGGLVWRFDPLHRTPAAKPFIEAEATSLWRGVRAPTVSLFGEHGMVPEGLDKRHAALFDVLAGWIPGAGHNLHHERPELVAEVIENVHRTRRPYLPSQVRAGEP